MTFSRLQLILFAALLLALVVPGTADAQFRTPTDTLSVGGRTSAEDGFLKILNLNRSFLGPRALGMGGTGLAIEGGVQYFAINPAGILGATRWELTSEYSVLSGSGSVSSFPAKLDVGAGAELNTSGYRISPDFESNYKNLTLGIPLVLLGKRGALGLSYRRLSPIFQGDETRFEASGSITNDIPATLGVGLKPDGGHDAITVALARNMSERFDFGMNFNFQSGTISTDTNVGASVFGQPVTGGGSSYDEDISGFNIDLGGKGRLGKLTLGGAIYLGHDLKFKNGTATFFPLPDIQDPNSPVFRIDTNLLDYTQSIPTQFGIGASYQVSDRLMVAADYWSRPWSKSEITRQTLTPSIFFVDPGDSTTYAFVLSREGGEETFSARLDDSNSLRFGVEYMLRQGEDFEVPFRIGFRTETLPISNTTVPEAYSNYSELVLNYWRDLQDGDLSPEGQAQRQELLNVAEYSNLLFRGKGIDATAFSAGIGLRVKNLRVDMAGEIVNYDIDRFFYQDFNPNFLFGNPFASATQESRSLRAVTFSTTLTF